MRSPLAILFLLIPFLPQAQVSPFNGLKVSQPARDGSYRMIISGHLHGSSRDRSGYPASTILAQLDGINSLGAAIFLSTGDLFLDPPVEHEQYRSALFEKLRVPLFNAPGNHDTGGLYDRMYGPTHLAFPLGGDHVVLLDTERNNGSLDREQLGTLEQLLAGEPPPRIFIVSHRPVWSEDDERYGPLFKGNTRSLTGNNYRRAVHPLVERLAERSQVIWFSGSMAGGAPSSFFFAEHAPGITYIQTAIRNEPWDALLLADVGPAGISWSAMSLAGREVNPPTNYDVDWWWAQRGVREPFNWRLLPYQTLMALRQPLLWYGMLAGMLLLLVIRSILRRLL